MYKILIIAGEPSGDNLGSKLIKEMKIQFDEEVDQKIPKIKNCFFKELVVLRCKMRDLYVFIKLKNYQSWVFLMFLKVSEKFIQ